MSGLMTCVISGLDPGTGYVVRVRARHANGKWSSWAKSLPVATLAPAKAEEEDPLRASSAAQLQGLYDSLVEATDDSEVQPDPSAAVRIVAAHPQLCAEATEFLVESLGPLGSPSAAAAPAPFSPALHKTLVALLALCTQPSFVEHARRDEPLIARLWQLTEYTCIPHPQHGEKPQAMLRGGAQKVLEKLGDVKSAKR